MTILTTKAYAKINITLDILGKRPDGYHEMCMVMQAINLCDDIRLEIGTGKPDQMKANLSYLPNDERNLALLAARRFFERAGKDAGGLRLELIKRIPVCAGLGGGSADAAAVLLCLQSAFPNLLHRDDLFCLANELGSDVPFCMLGGTALATGRGEKLLQLKTLPSCWCVLCKPDFPLSTRMMFSRISGSKIRRHPDTKGVIAALEQGDLHGVTCRMYNVFEDFLGSRAREIAAIRQTLMEHNALGAVMSGSGPTVFGLFENQTSAEEAWNALKREYKEVFLVSTRP